MAGNNGESLALRDPRIHTIPLGYSVAGEGRDHLDALRAPQGHGPGHPSGRGQHPDLDSGSGSRPIVDLD